MARVFTKKKKKIGTLKETERASRAWGLGRERCQKEKAPESVGGLPSHAHPNARPPQRSVASMPMADDDGLISGLTEEQLITNEEMDGLVKEVRRGWARNPSIRSDAPRARVFFVRIRASSTESPRDLANRSSSRHFGYLVLTRVQSRRAPRVVVVSRPRPSVPFVTHSRARRRSSKPSARTRSCTRR